MEFKGKSTRKPSKIIDFPMKYRGFNRNVSLKPIHLVLVKSTVKLLRKNPDFKAAQFVRSMRSTMGFMVDILNDCQVTLSGLTSYNNV